MIRQLPYRFLCFRFKVSIGKLPSKNNERIVAVQGLEKNLHDCIKTNFINMTKFEPEHRTKEKSQNYTTKSIEMNCVNSFHRAHAHK